MEKEFIYNMKMVLYYQQELQTNGNNADGIMAFWENLRDHGVVIRIIHNQQGRSVFSNLIRQEETTHKDGICREEILVIAATDETIQEAALAGVAVFAWKNPDYPNESLMASPVLVESFEELDYEFAERIWRRYHKLPWNILTTARCYVRELSLGDMEDLFVMYEQKGMTDYMEPLYESEEEMEYQKAYIENMYGFYGYGMWLVFDRQTDELIGRAGIENRELHGTFELELGYAIAPAYQGKGYATEVCTAILAYARERLECREINCMIQKENQPSLALAKKLGFHYLETIEEKEQSYERYVFSWIGEDSQTEK